MKCKYNTIDVNYPKQMRRFHPRTLFQRTGRESIPHIIFFLNVS